MNTFTKEQIELIKSFVSYNELTGELRWKYRQRQFFETAHLHQRWNARYDEMEITGPQIEMPLVGKPYSTRVAYIIKTGSDLGGKIIRFKDGDKSNRKWSNLIACSYSELEKDFTPKSIGQHLDFFRECFLVDEDRLIWRERPRSHFRSDRAWKLFNTRMAGKGAGTPQGRDRRLQLHFSSVDGGLHVYCDRVIHLMKTGIDSVT